MAYFLFRCGEKGSYQYRIEAGATVEEACKKAFGTVYTDAPTIRFKNVGTRAPKYIPQKHKTLWYGDEGWQVITRKKEPIRVIKAGDRVTVKAGGGKPFVVMEIDDRMALLNNNRLVPLSDLRWLESSPAQVEEKKEEKPTPTPPHQLMRKVGIDWRNIDGANWHHAVIRIENGGVFNYLAERVTADRFTLRKLQFRRETVYHVCIEGNNVSCGCDGFRQHQHCKHIESLQALRKQERL